MSSQPATDRELRKACGCCGGIRLVESYDGQMRPCSRCSMDAFYDWSKRRRDAVIKERAAKRAAEEAHG